MNDAVNHWIAHYGVLGVFLAAAMEGEIGVLVGGAMAHLGKLNLLSVALAAWAAAFLSAQVFFYAGRSQRDSKWVRKVTEKRSFARALQWIDHHPWLFCLFYRFVYGMRIVGAVAISLSQIRARTYLAFNIITSLVWAVVGVSLGWWFGPGLAHAARAWLTPQHFAIASGLSAILLLGVIGWRANTRRGTADVGHEMRD